MIPRRSTSLSHLRCLKRFVSLKVRSSRDGKGLRGFGAVLLVWLSGRFGGLVKVCVGFVLGL